MLESLKTTLKAIQAMLNKCVKKVNGLTPDADGNVNVKIQVGWQEVTDKPTISAGAGMVSIREGLLTTASGTASHAEGDSTTASGYSSHAEGGITTASGEYSHADGFHTTASERASHAEGEETTASGRASHAEGFRTTASGEWSHAEGHSTTASGSYSHAEGEHTIASSWKQHVQGKFNIENASGIYAHIVGNGGSEEARSNAHTLDWDGNAWFAGDVYVGSTSGTNKDEGSKKLATEEYVEQLLGVIENGTY